MTDRFSIFVAYTQVLVHLASHPRPGLIWTDAHVAQGFAWADGVVSFGAPDHDGPCLIEVQPFGSGALVADALWAVQVPFKVAETLMIGTVFDMRPVSIPVGQYNLVFEALAGRDDHALGQAVQQVLLSQGATGVFGEAPKAEPEPTIDVKTLHAKIGELTLENDLYEEVSVKGAKNTTRPLGPVDV
jgi:hypothetical protein